MALAPPGPRQAASQLSAGVSWTGEVLTRGHPLLASRPGTYALVLASSKAMRIPVGSFGELSVRPGFYVYVGSAFGPGGVKARTGRHRSRARRRRWHVDYLRSATRLEDIWFTHDPNRREHDWAAVVSEDMGGVAPLLGFGASDCDCKSHLYYFRTRPSGRSFARCVHRRHRGHGAVWIEAKR